MSYVWGADVGGTTTRVGVASTDGRVRCVVTAGPGNPHAVGVSTSADRIRAAARQALLIAGAPPTAPGVVGLAGVTAVDPDAFARLVDPAETPALHSRDANGPAAGHGSVRVVPDLGVAFASGTPATEGIIALAGTGAGAMLVRAGRTLQRRNAWGWLLGDEGSAQWIGREAVRHALRRLERPTEPLDSLTSAVLDRAEAAPEVPALIRAVYSRPPSWLATLAPLVDTAARSGRADAAAILDTAAGQVVTFATALAAGRPEAPIVLAGSLLGPGGPLAPRVRAALGGYDNPITDVTDGIAGACWLALTAGGPAPATVHARLVASAAAAPRHRLVEQS